MTIFISIFRYWRVLKLGIKSRRTKSPDDLEAVYCANNDVCLLRLFESFLESAPQLLLQLYVIITFHHFDWLIGKVKFAGKQTRVFQYFIIYQCRDMIIDDHYDSNLLALYLELFHRWAAWVPILDNLDLVLTIIS